VSELTGLRISNLYIDIGFIRVLGKGNKERLVPIGEGAIKFLLFYLDERKQLENIDKKSEDIVFLNRRGKQLTRNMIFLIVKEAAQAAGIEKNVSPHTFRHSFATHLIEGGADLRIVQQLLGHESITTTEIYTHLDMNFLRETLRSFHPRMNRK
jgi:integrase/recombinase XerD